MGTFTEVYNQSWPTTPTGSPDPSTCVTVNISAATTQQDTDPVSRSTTYLFSRVKETLLMPVLFLVGVPSNCLNLAVFCRQGLHQRINLCLFSLALVDLVFVAYVFLKNVDNLRIGILSGGINPSLCLVGPVTTWLVRHRLFGFYGFGWASIFVSAVAAADRCSCVALPLRSRTMVRTRTVALVLLLGVALIVGGQFYVLGQLELTCLLDSATSNRYPQVRRKYLGDKAVIDFLDSVVLGIAVPGTSVTVVTLSTAVITSRLAQTAQFRKRSSSWLMSPKEVALTRMLVALSVQFVVLNLPMGILRTVKFFYPVLDFNATLGNTYEVTIGLFETFLMLNCSTNFFAVYVLVGSRYRNTVRAMFGCKPQKAIMYNTQACSDKNTTVG